MAASRFAQPRAPAAAEWLHRALRRDARRGDQNLWSMQRLVNASVPQVEGGAAAAGTGSAAVVPFAGSLPTEKRRSRHD